MTDDKKDRKKMTAKVIAAFSLILFLCSVMIFITILNRSNLEKSAMEQLIQGKGITTNEVISKLLYKTQALSALVIQSDGTVEDFDRVAATIVDDPAILNVLIAPGGVVSNVYPLQGNEAVIGLDFFGEGEGNKEAVMAKESGQLVLGGPFNLVQGGQALVGRLPVYLDTPDGNKSFWGLVSVTLRFPQALDGADLKSLEAQGFLYEIWRINPDDNKRQIIASSDNQGASRMRFIEQHTPILNADWIFRIAPIRHWYEYAETWPMILAGLCVSLLVAFTLQNNLELRLVKTELESMSRIDSLTGIFNRRHFMEIAAMQIERSIRSKSNCFVIIFDVDHFKIINDKYGHPSGDEVLRDITVRVKNTIRPYDLFARYGGEEFIMLVADSDKEAVQKLAERACLCISEMPFVIDGADVTITASFGIAPATPANDLDAAIKLADVALYKAKEDGRNRVVFQDVNDKAFSKAL